MTMSRRAWLGTWTGTALGVAHEAYTARLWQLAEPVFQQTMAHPFLTGLADGSLPMEKFRFYMIQDALYLTRYAKALNVLASKAPQEDWGLFFTRGAIECIETERKLHEGFFERQDLVRAVPAPTNAAYTNHLLATVYEGSFTDGLAAVTPCYWIYAKAGKRLKRQGSKMAAYQRWIDQYAGEDFSTAVRQVLEMINRSMPVDRERFERLFMRSVRYEYLFWDMAWRLEQWAV